MTEINDEEYTPKSLPFFKAMAFLVVTSVVLTTGGVLGFFGFLTMAGFACGRFPSQQVQDWVDALSVFALGGGVLASCFVTPYVFRFFYKK